MQNYQNLQFLSWLTPLLVLVIGYFMQQKFADIDKRFSDINKRFDKMDREFDKIDRKFDRFDEKFDKMEINLGQIENGRRPIIPEVPEAI